MTAVVPTREPGRMAERCRRVNRVLELVRLGHGTFTVRQGQCHTGWEERSIHRYITELHQRGLIAPTIPGRVKFRRWELTQAGKDALAG